MGVILSTPPPSFAFSADLISAKFTCSNYLSQAGVFSVNTVPVAGAVLTLKYSGKVIVMSPAAAPDDSGTQYATSGTMATKLINFQNNFQLSQDFNISISGSNLLLIAKKASIGYDITGFNSTIGKPELVKPSYSIAFKLFCENADNTGFTEIHTANLQVEFSDTGLAEATLGDKLNNHILNDLRINYPDVPSANAVLCKKSCRKYYFEFAERYGQPAQGKKVYTSPVYTILQGGLSYIGQFNSTLQSLIAPGAAAADRFLKQGNNTIYTRTNQPQYLYFFNTRTLFAGVLQIRAFFKDGTSVSHNIYSQNYEGLRKYTFDLTYDKVIMPLFGSAKVMVKYEVQLLTSALAARSETRTYYLNYQYREYVRYFLSWSSFGSMDTRLCYGKGNSEFELTQKEASRIVKRGYDIKQGNSQAYDISLKSGFKVATGWLTRRELIANRDFYLSAFKYRLSRGLMLPIRIDSKTIPEIEDGNNLFAQLFEYSYQFDDHNYTEGDDEESGVSFGDFFFNSDPIGNPTAANEKDPTVPAWVKSITQADIDFWNSRGAGGPGGGGNGGDGNYIINQSDLQIGANFHIEKGKFHTAVTFPLIEPPVKEPGSLWIGTGATAGIPSGGSNYILPIASVSVIGGIKIGSGLNIDPLTGVLSVLSESPLSFTSPLIRVGNTVSLSAGIFDSETLDAVTNRGADTSNNLTLNGRVSITGDLRIPNLKSASTGLGSMWMGDGATAGIPSGGGSLATLSDVLLTSLTSGQSIVWNGTKWVNQNVAVDFTNYYTKTESNARFLPLHGTADNSTAWNGQSMIYSEISTSPYYLMGYNVADSAWRPTRPDGIKLALGLGSNAYTSTAYLPLAGGILTGALVGTTIAASRLIAGYDSQIAGSVNASGWFRSNGASGWFNDTYGGGIFMQDTTWVRVYNNKGLSVKNTVQATDFQSTNTGFWCRTFHGMSGDYDLTGATDKIIWTVSSQYNTIANMYGIGYQYTSKYNSAAHQIVFRNNGVVTCAINCASGNANFDGTVQSSIVKAVSNLIIPTARPTGPVAGSIWIA